MAGAGASSSISPAADIFSLGEGPPGCWHCTQGWCHAIGVDGAACSQLFSGIILPMLWDNNNLVVPDAAVEGFPEILLLGLVGQVWLLKPAPCMGHHWLMYVGVAKRLLGASGCLAFELLTGSTLLTVGNSLSEYRAKIASMSTADLTAVDAQLLPTLRAMLAPSPSSRPPASAFAGCLYFQVQELLSGLSCCQSLCLLLTPGPRQPRGLAVSLQCHC